MYTFKQDRFVFSVLIVCILVFLFMRCSCLYTCECTQNEQFTDTLYENIPTVSACRSKCNTLGDTCKAYTYNTNTKICNAISQPVLVNGQYQAGTVSYYLPSVPSVTYTTPYTSTTGTTYLDPFGLISVFNTLSQSTCQDTCCGVLTCIGYTYDTATTSCALHSDFGGPATATGTATTYVLSNASIILPQVYYSIPGMFVSTPINSTLLLWYTFNNWTSGTTINNYGTLGTANNATEAMQQ